MLSYNDSWLMNESLAYYMSTNTFTNPIFDAMIESNPTTYDEPDQGIERPVGMSTNGNTNNRKGKGVQAFSWRPGRCTNFCDSLAFSLRSKMYVLELDLKRLLQGFKRFADKRMPWLVRRPYRFQRKEDATNRVLPSGLHADEDENHLRQLYSARQVNWSPVGKQQDKFWLNYIEPDSRESLGQQKEKILYRLEQAIEEKRNNNNNNMNRQLFNMNDGLPFVRPIGASLSSSSRSATSSWLSSAARSPPKSPSSSADGNSFSPPMGSRVKNGASTRTTSSSTTKRSRARWSFTAAGAAAGAGHHAGQQVGPDNESELDAKLCVVCYTNLPNIVTLPCKHDEICSDCFIELIYVAVKHSRYPLKCVLCRQKIERIRCSRSLLLSVIRKNRITP